MQRCIAHSRRQRAGGDTKKARVGVVLESEELAGPAILTPRTGLEKTAPGVKSFFSHNRASTSLFSAVSTILKWKRNSEAARHDLSEVCYVAKSEILSLSSDVEEVHNNRTPTTVAWKSSPPRHAADLLTPPAAFRAGCVAIEDN